MNRTSTKAISDHNIELNWKQKILIETSKYIVKLALSEEELSEVFRIRYQVFHDEMGLRKYDSSRMDIDKFDEQFHHLIAVSKESNRIIGTYRLQKYEDAVNNEGFYSEAEFKISELSEEILKAGVEVGRACILKESRNTLILLLLWQGLAKFLSVNNLYFIYGCGSINSDSPYFAKRISNYINEKGFMHPKFHISIQKKYTYDFQSLETNSTYIPDEKIILPPLLALYLKYGTKICSEPAFDYDFKTFDFFLLMDVRELSDINKKRFFPDS